MALMVIWILIKGGCRSARGVVGAPIRDEEGQASERGCKPWHNQRWWRHRFIHTRYQYDTRLKGVFGRIDDRGESSSTTVIHTYL